MIRGISKKIIEVNNTGSDFFEKAVFYVKCDTNKSDKELKNEANKIIISYFSEFGDGYKIGYLRKKDKLKKKKLIFVLSTLFVAVCIFAILLTIF